jgi:hypothetical protein
MAKDVDLVKLAETVGAAAAEASNNTKSLIEMHKRLDEHVIDQNTQFMRLQEKIERNAAESTVQHNELASKVDAITHGLGRCVANHVEAAVQPVIDEVKNHRKLMWSVAGGFIAVLLAVVAYLLTQGVPWDTAMAAHANGSFHRGK